MEMKTVKSSNFGKIGYEKEKLRIEFKSGGVYEYSDVPKKIYQDFIKADSLGKYFHAKIRPKYEFKKIESTKPEDKKEQTMDRPTIVCLCGSTRFYKEYRAANFHETMAGRIVLSVGYFSHSAEKAHELKIDITAKKKAELDELHKRKIDLADEILVLNIDGYIGDSTRTEIEYAKKHNKKIRSLEPLIYSLIGVNE